MASRQELATKWNGWGAPGARLSFAERPGLEPYLARRLAVYSTYPIGGLQIEEITLADSRLTEGARRDLAAIVGGANLADDREARIRHALGKSYEDLLHARRGEIDNAPDAVLYPASGRDVRELLAWAAEHDAAIVPFGGGTCTGGGVEPRRGRGQELALTLDLGAMQTILSLDARALVARAEPGIRGADLQARLKPQGLRFGHEPQSLEFSTLGGWIATRSSGRSGSIDRKVLSLQLETPVGTLEAGADAPRAAGPDLLGLALGSEGALGVVTLASIALEPRPESRAPMAFLLPSLEQGLEAAREALDARLPLAWLELHDVDATEAQMALEPRGGALTDHLRRGLGRVVLERRGAAHPVLLAAAVEGAERLVDRVSRDLARLVASRDGYDMGPHSGRNVDRDFFTFPYLRDLLIDVGVVVETFQAAAPWPALPKRHAELKRALERACEEQNARAVVAGKLTRLEPGGGTVELVVLAGAGGDELTLVRACRSAAREAMLRARGRLAPDGGIGTMRRDWLVAERGPAAAAALGALKRALDPAGVLNPDKLLGEPE